MILTRDQFADLLEWLAGRVRAGDSYEGNLDYTWPKSGAPDDVSVGGALRYGNLDGQGCVRLLEVKACERDVGPSAETGE